MLLVNLLINNKYLPGTSHQLYSLVLQVAEVGWETPCLLLLSAALQGSGRARCCLQPGLVPGQLYIGRSSGLRKGLTCCCHLWLYGAVVGLAAATCTCPWSGGSHAIVVAAGWESSSPATPDGVWLLGGWGQLQPQVAAEGWESSLPTAANGAWLLRGQGCKQLHWGLQSSGLPHYWHQGHACL